MRIFSKYHDYYDSALAFGVDPNIIYKRKEIEFPKYSLEAEYLYGIEFIESTLKRGPNNCRYYHQQQYNHVSSEPLILIFCGKLYPGLRVSINWQRANLHWSEVDDHHLNKICWSHSDVKSHLEKYKIEWEKEPRGRKQQWGRYGRHLRFTSDNVKEFFDLSLFGNIDMKVQDIHFKFDTPSIAIWHRDSFKCPVIFNPVLKDIDFIRRLDPYNTFQELSMFISGVMGGQTPKMVEVSDEIRKQKHGFDETSFRKPPQKTK